MSGLARLSRGHAQARRLADGAVDDPALPLLAELMTPATARRWWDATVPSTEGLSGGDLESVEALRYRPGRRCTLRLRFGGTEPRVVYVKLYRGGRARRVAKALGRLAEQGPWVDLALPPVLAHARDDGVLVFGELEGRPWESLLEESAERPAALAARALARLASLSPDGLRPWAVSDELEVITERAARARAQDPALAARVLAELERLDAAANGVRQAPAAPLHRDLHPSQVLVEMNRAGFVDVDDLAAGPACIDAGNLLAHLDMFAQHLPAAAASFAGAASRFRAELASAGWPVPDDQLDWARAASLLRLAALHAERGDVTELPPRLVALATDIISSV